MQEEDELVGKEENAKKGRGVPGRASEMMSLVAVVWFVRASPCGLWGNTEAVRPARITAVAAALLSG